MKKFLLLCLLCLPLTQGEAAETAADNAKLDKPAQEENPEFVEKVGYFDFITNIPGDYVGVAKTLFRKETIPSFLAVAGLTGIAIKYDYETWQATRKIYRKNYTFEKISDAGAQLGVGGSQIALGAILVGTGLVTSDNRAIRTGSQITEAVIATGITTQFLKHIFCRESPNVAIEPITGKWQWFTNPRKYHRRVSAHDAFPSGHVATAFATATVIMENYPEQSWIPYVAYPTVFLVGMGMVAKDGHWWADYPLSVLLGYHFGRSVTRRNPEAKDREKKVALNIWMPKPGIAGLQLTGRF